MPLCGVHAPTLTSKLWEGLVETIMRFTRAQKHFSALAQSIRARGTRIKQLVLQGTVSGTSEVSSSVENSNAIETMAEGGSLTRTSSPPTDEGIRSMEQGKLWLGWRCV